MGLLQALVWLPNLFDPPWSLPTPLIFGRWILWSGSYFDLGRATDFFPALSMVLSGLFMSLVGFRRIFTDRSLKRAILAEGLAILVLVLMQLIGSASGVWQWRPLDYNMVLTLSVK